MQDFGRTKRQMRFKTADLIKIGRPALRFKQNSSDALPLWGASLLF